MTIAESVTFKTVVDHMRLQGRPAVDAGNCRYRTDSGYSCAVGCLIPDKDYSPEMEGWSVTSNLVRDTVKHHNVQLLVALQRIHDHDHVRGGADCGESKLRYWGPDGLTEAAESALQTVAEEYGCVYEPPTKLDLQ